MHKLQEGCDQVDTFGKRLGLMEQKLITEQDKTDKNHKSLQEFV